MTLEGALCELEESLLDVLKILHVQRKQKGFHVSRMDGAYTVAGNLKQGHEEQEACAENKSHPGKKVPHRWAIQVLTLVFEVLVSILSSPVVASIRSVVSAGP